MILIETFEDPFYTQIVAMDGTDYILDFRFNERESCWYFDILQIDGTELLKGIKVVCEVPLLEDYKANPLMPQGEMLASASGADKSPPGLTELGEGKRVELVYATVEDLAGA
jgi:hypothetical protein